jgi:hypothetical protein
VDTNFAMEVAKISCADDTDAEAPAGGPLGMGRVHAGLPCHRPTSSRAPPVSTSLVRADAGCALQRRFHVLVWLLLGRPRDELQWPRPPLTCWNRTSFPGLPVHPLYYVVLISREQPNR